MKLSNIVLNLCIGFLCLNIFGQSVVKQKDTISNLQIFEKAEVDYIKNWMEDLIKEEEMSPEIASSFRAITADYGLKMKQLGKNPKLFKNEIISSFNKLIKEQDMELKQILPNEQFERFSKFYDRLCWSVNKRLNQL